MIALAVLLSFLSGSVDEFRIFQAATVAVYVVAISSVILLTGYSGQISLGQGALLAIGGYAATLLKIHFNAHLLLCFAGAIVITALFGLLLGLSAARLSGPYLAGATLALAVGLPSITNYFSWLGGEEGLIFDIGMPWAALGEDFSLSRWFFIIAAFMALVAMWWMHNVVTSRYGRIWRAMRSQPVAAELAGINVSQQKVIAFGVSSGVAGLAGALLAMVFSTVSPGAYPLSLSFLIAAGAVLSGLTTLGGALVGAIALVAIPEISGVIAEWLGGAERVTNNLPNFIVNLLLILTVLFVPDGPIEQMRRRKAHRSSKPSNE